jgi:hypothetical protein
MRQQAQVKSNSIILGKINATRMSEHERQVAIDAMRNADVFVDGLLWTLGKIEHLFGASATKH